MGFSLFPSSALHEVRAKAAYHDDQALGQQIGRIDIRCTLKAGASHWTKSASCMGAADITGLLFFNIEYNDHGAVPLRSASVQIDVGAGINEEPIPIFKTCAPLSAITGSPVKQHIMDNKTKDPQAEVTSSFGSLKGSGYSHEVSKEFDNEHRWYFKAGNCSDKHDPRVTRTSFNWMRTLLEDRTGSNRSYDGALVLHREKDEPFILRVTVGAQPWKWYHRIRYSGSKTRDSGPIQPRPDSLLKPEEFAKVQRSIQEQILARNMDLAATGVFDSSFSSGYTANVVTEVPNVRLTAPPFAQSETSIVEQPSGQQDETTQMVDGLNMTNLLLDMSANVVEQVSVA
jgi:hypothetical protein